MRKLSYILLAVFTVGFVIALSLNHYQNNKRIKDSAYALEAKALDANLLAIKTAQERATDLEAAYSKLHLECEKGHAAYDTLTEAQRTNRTPEPLCGPAIVP